MGAGSSSLLARKARSFRRSLWSCPSWPGTPVGKRYREPHSAPSGQDTNPLGRIVRTLDNPPDVIEAHEKYLMQGRQEAVRYQCYSPASPRLQTGHTPYRDYGDRSLPTQHQHPLTTSTSPACSPCKPSSRPPSRPADSVGLIHRGRRSDRAHQGHGHDHAHRDRANRRSRGSSSQTRSSRASRTSRKTRDRRDREDHRKNAAPRGRTSFGYNIEDVDGFLAKACLDNPANIPMVLACACTLFRTREGGWQEEVSLPLGMVVNGVFRVSCWLYAQTPHGHEGYVHYKSCLPLGILPHQFRVHTAPLHPTTVRSRPRCWDTASDIICSGNRTDNDKMKDTRSERAYAPCSSRRMASDRRGGRRLDGLQLQGLMEARRAEQTVDALYLRASRASLTTAGESHGLDNFEIYRGGQAEVLEVPDQKRGFSAGWLQIHNIPGGSKQSLSIEGPGLNECFF